MGWPCVGSAGSTDHATVIDDRPAQPATTGPDHDPDLGPAGFETWTPSTTAEERLWRDQLSEEIRPLEESLARLRERGLLD